MRARHGYRFVSMDAEQRTAILQEIDQNSLLGQNFLVLVVLSCIVATFGLIQNSAAVIIGAMLIAPLMGPIIAFSMALIYGVPHRVTRALTTLVIGAVISVALSAVLGRLVTVVGTVDFGAEGLPSEILGRTQPALFDLAVALAGGAAGSYALVQPRLSSALAGVAIATALMPPLCVVGIGISQGQFSIWSGALVLFLTNFVAIVFASSAIFALAGFLPAAGTRRHPLLPGARLVNLLLLLPVVALLTFFTLNITKQAQTAAAIRTTLKQELGQYHDTDLVSFDQTASGDTLQIVATIRSPSSLKLKGAIRIEAALAARLGKRVALKLLVVPVTDLDPLNPPTFSPTPTPSATSTPSRTPTSSRTPTTGPSTATKVDTTVSGVGTETPAAVLGTETETQPTGSAVGTAAASARATASTTAIATFTLLPSSTVTPPPRPTHPPSLTVTPRPTHTVSPTTTPHPSATATWTPRPSSTGASTPRPTATRTPRPAATRTPRPAATRTPRPTATPIAYAVVGGTRGLGVYAYRSPEGTAIVAALPDGAVVELTGTQRRQGPYLWVRVILSDGRVLWIPNRYLLPYGTYTQP